jgi:hypothetical protein
MNNLKELYNKVVKSSAFDKFGYLSHFFVLANGKLEPMGDWQVGFYDKKTKEVESFIASSEVKAAEKSKPLGNEAKDVEKLSLSKIKIGFDEAVSIAKKLHTEKYSSQPPKNAFIIVQSLEGIPTWNITMITITYSTINIKINAETGEIYKHDISSLLYWGGSKQDNSKTKK